MAAGSASRIINNPGKLVVGPTNAFDGGTYPYGGTEVGYVKAVALRNLGVAFAVMAEGLGEFNDILEPNNDYEFAFFLRGWDDDAIQKFMSSGYVAGGVSQHSLWNAPGSLTPGQTSLGRGITVVYVPDDTLTQPAVMVYNFIPSWDTDSDIAFARQDPMGVPISGKCLRNSSGNIIRIGHLPDLSLT